MIEYHASELPKKSFLERLDEFKKQNPASEEGSSQKKSESENKVMSVRVPALHQEPCPVVGDFNYEKPKDEVVEQQPSDALLSKPRVKQEKLVTPRRHHDSDRVEPDAVQSVPKPAR